MMRRCCCCSVKTGAVLLGRPSLYILMPWATILHPQKFFHILEILFFLIGILNSGNKNYIKISGEQ